MSYCIRVLYLISLLIASPIWAANSYQWSIFHGQFTEKDLGNALLFSYQPMASYLVAMDFGITPDKQWQPLWHLSDKFEEYSISQSLQLNLSYVYKGDECGFGLNPFLATSIDKLLPASWPVDLGYSAGVGLSYYGYLPDKATYMTLADTSQPYKSTRWLCYLMFEWQLKYKQLPNWALTWRIHHRSRCYGVFYPKQPGIHVGSDYFGLGIRYYF